MAVTMSDDGRKRKREADGDTDTKSHIKTPPASPSSYPDVKRETYETPPSVHEKLPKLAAFDPTRVPNREHALSTIKKLFEVIAPLEDASKSLKNIARNARRWAEDPAKLNPVKPVIAFVGKSSTQNSIMDEDDLARTGSSGDACTNIPMFYMCEIPGQALAYAGKVVYMKLSEIRRLLRTQLSQYYMYHFDPQEEWDATTKIEFGNLASTAQNTFYVIFRNKKECSSPGAVANFLRTKRQAKIDPLDQMMGWVKEHFATLQTIDGLPCRFFETDSPEDLKAELLELTDSDHSKDMGSMWPLVAEAYVGDKKSEILKYVTMLDLPGVTDTNQLRVDMTDKHFSSVDALLCVVPAERAIANPEVERIVGVFAEKFATADSLASRLAIIISKNDTGLGAGLAKDMPRKGQSIGDYNEYCEERALLMIERKTLRAERGNDLEPDNKIRLHDITTRMAELERLCNMCLSDARFNWIKTSIIQDKNKHLPAGKKLRIMGVSNAWYRQWLQPGEAEGVSSSLPVCPDDTGIIAVRTYLRALAAPGITQADDNLILGEIPNFHSALQLYVEHCPSKQLDMMLEVVKTWPAHWKKLVDAAERETMRIFARLFEKVMAELPASLRAGLKVIKNVIGMRSASQLMVFFAHNGKHGTARVKPECWNELLLAYQTEEVFKSAWAAARTLQSEAYNACVHKMIEEVKKLPQLLAANPAGMAVSETIFAEILKSRSVLINNAYKKAKRTYEAEVAQVRINATTDTNGAYFTEAMKPCYDKGKGEKGKGVGARLKELIETYLTQDTPLEKAEKAMEEALKAAVHKQADSVHGPVDTILTSIVDQMMAKMQQEDHTETEDETAARLKLAKELPGFVREFNGIKKIHESNKTYHDL
nr:hypothetical protein B0A51_11127 [Rachicladosporium sp. CCFEE 5018]